MTTTRTRALVQAAVYNSRRRTKDDGTMCSGCADGNLLNFITDVSCFLDYVYDRRGGGEAGGS